jgi:hypothetical protein
MFCISIFSMILADNYIDLNAEMIGASIEGMAKSGFSIAASYPPSARPGGQTPAIILQSGNRFNFSCSTSGTWRGSARK